MVSNQAVNLLLNAQEFGEVYTRTVYYSILSGMILAAIAFVRVNFVNRHSIVWYSFRTIASIVKRGEFSRGPAAYSDFKMSPLSFGLWQVTKVVLLAPLFGNIVFGMAIDYMLDGNDVGLGLMGNVFSIPFADVPSDGSFSKENVVPLIPALTMIMPPILAAVGVRLLVYVGISGAISIVSQYVNDVSERKPRFLSYISRVEIIVGTVIFWAGFSAFFNSTIDYNTQYVIAGSLLLGAAFIGFGFFDRIRSKVMIYPNKKHVYSRLVTVAAVVIVVSTMVFVNSGIADAKKVEWRGPYIAQEIAINQSMADLDKVNIINYDVKPPSISTSQIKTVVDENRENLSNIRLWDQEAATSKLKPELGQRNDIVFADTDILRFGDTMYWAGTTTPKLPDSARGNEWFNQHLVYTHANTGIKTLEADTGNLADESRFFEQRRIYYGETGTEGLFSRYWSAHPVGRSTSTEIDGFFYSGTGGVDMAPPLSWMFEPNFMLSYPDTPIHVMRYKDIHDRMEILYPYFAYHFGFSESVTPNFQKVDAFPVTDGQNTYWLMPLIAGFDTSHVPWAGPFMLKLTGYSLIDTYNGSTQIIVTGDDKFSEMFYEQYKDIGATRQVPEWLSEQIRYPEEMFIWKIAKFNHYHVTDPKTFIEGTKFYDIPQDQSRDVPPYYIITKPQGFEKPEFVGFQSLELSGSQSKNLVGYMIVQNNLANLGQMSFYSVPQESATKLIGPTAAREALEKDKDYKNVKTLLQGSSKLGENILYKIGDEEVYFIPVYTANNAGGVVSQIGTIAVVGASVTGNFYVGLGDTPVQAFENYLLKSAGQEPSATLDIPAAIDTDAQGRILILEKIFADAGISVAKPTAISAPLEFQEGTVAFKTEADRQAATDAVSSFISKYSISGRVLEWQDANKVNFGILTTVDGIVEVHYISIEVS
ncbi:MAG: hypothetical protein DA330_03420 [Nitrososphaera sp.]|nr:hypothetical protein [Nitrososphaera sp.]